MGNSTQQWRSAIGCFSSKCSSFYWQKSGTSQILEASRSRLFWFSIFSIFCTILAASLAIMSATSTSAASLSNLHTWPALTSPPQPASALSCSTASPAIWLFSSIASYISWSPATRSLTASPASPSLCSCSRFPSRSPSSCWVPQLAFWLTNKDRNQLARALNGNRQNRGIKLAHWNAGSAYLANKMHEIEQVVSDNHPHVLGISESNLKRNHDIEEVQLQGYDLVVCKTMENDNLQISRVVCYKHQSLVAEVRDDLMSDQFSSIWLEVGLPGRSKILVCQLYREWRYLGQPDRGIYSNSIQEQLHRWLIFLDQWDRALSTGKEVLVLGDCNLDHQKFDNDVLLHECGHGCGHLYEKTHRYFG